MFPLINKRETGVNLRSIMEIISELDAPLKHHNRYMPSQKCGGFFCKKRIHRLNNKEHCKCYFRWDNNGTWVLLILNYRNRKQEPIERRRKK